MRTRLSSKYFHTVLLSISTNSVLSMTKSFYAPAVLIDEDFSTHIVTRAVESKDEFLVGRFYTIEHDLATLPQTMPRLKDAKQQ